MTATYIPQPGEEPFDFSKANGSATNDGDVIGDDHAPQQDAKKGPPAATAGLICMANVEAQPVRSLWPGRIPFGMLSMVEGDPGLGKSLIKLDIAARVSTGRPMPDGTPYEDERRGVLLVLAEDALAYTVKPRLTAAGADCANVHVLDHIMDGKTRRHPTVEDADAIIDAAVKIKAALIIIEPIMAFLGEANAHKDQDVRAALAPLVQHVEKGDVALMFGRHLKKSTGETQSLYRGGGSIAFTAAARSGFLVAHDPEDESGSRRFFAHFKHNVYVEAPTLAYRVVTIDLPGVGPSPLIEWEQPDEEQPCPTADAVLKAMARHAADHEDEASKLAEATAFLEGELAQGPVPSVDLLRDGRELGHTEPTVRRAGKALGIIVEKDGKRWTWRLPQAPH